MPGLSADAPRYLQVQACLTALLSVEPAARLPTERQLSVLFGVSRITIRKSLGLMERQGLIVRRRRSGTFGVFPKA